MTCWPSLARRLSVMGGSDTRSSAISLVLATCKIPHQEKIHKGGEDAVMYLPALNAFGVADGVGGYADQGVDPGKFSKALMRFSAEEIIGCAKRGEVLPLLQPEKIVRAAFNRIKEHKIEGGSTALICTLVENTLHVSNLGDCSLMIFRCEQNSPTLKLKMRSQTHFFNCPFQLSLTGKDTPEDSLTAKVELEPGDCILAASDGVFDNLFDDDIVQILQQELLKISEVDASESAKSQNVLWSRRTATLIATEALRRAIDSKPTPFEIEATREGFLINGGKLDDISVIFGRVVSREEINLS